MLIERIRSAFRREARELGQTLAPDPFSVVVCSRDDQRFAGLTANLGQAFGSHPYEMIRIADASSMCQGYNEGLKRSQGSRVIFCHDDIEILNEDFVQRLDRHFSQFDVFGPVGTTRLIDGSWFSAGRPDIHGSVVQPASDSGHPCALHMFSQTLTPVAGAQAVDGMFIGARRAAASKLGWDEANIAGFHLYDIDFSFRAHLAGMRVGIASDLLVYHASLGNRSQQWAQAVEDFNQRHAVSLSTAPRGDPTFMTAACPSKRVAYEYFSRQLEALKIGNARV